MKFWTFTQNNSGGSFVFDKERGITHHVIVEAPSLDDATARAESIGVYFNGVDAGRDCPCCGDRWYGPYGEGDEHPSIYGRNVRNPTEESGSTFGWMQEGFETCVHPLDGPLEWYGA